ncbi:GH92 family glycosyl hydrolase [Silvibacterium dinghuense]|uniref:Glycoside hydrolase family 92 protein n=1 Tax=Silvibacterium dinghuense TaxID=1560006 RepID=A0A4Q1S8V8_9BACT|nr:GH92 family glycosyl hydrolase [Silvibacterium dinghuense]RXS93323.1 glycoside hydrolase family 92 protein [Silvibacterium dinghuense]GGH04906.1 alpha-1 2-mannosidase [Silvibacterium dinghuense]
MGKAALLLSLSACLLPAALAAGQDAVSYVNPLLGTEKSAIGYGGTMPFVTPPFGMTNWTPQTRQNRLGVVSYNYDDPTISGFMGTHQPAIWMGDYGYITLMPESGALETTPEARALPYAHTSETAHPDDYAVTLQSKNGAIAAEMTATERCALMRFRFPKGGNATTAARILVEASRPSVAGMVTLDAKAHEITGYNPDRTDRNLGPFALPNFRGYFVVEFREAWRNAKTYGLDDASAKQSRGAYAEFTPGTEVEVRIGTSFLSIDQARENLHRELPAWNFDAVRAQLHRQWEEKLGRLQIDGATDREKSRLYTALYHALLYPRVFSEYGRYYSAFDDTIHNGESYTAYSIWDTFRAENSMLTLMAPERIDGMITALLQNFKEGGWMPKWPNPSYTNIMIATHADSLVAEAFRKGFHGFDRDVAWQAVYKDAMTPPDGDTTRRWYDREPHTPYEARAGLTYYKQLGYIPTDKTAEASSSTLEDSYDDWCVAQIAKALGKENDYRFFLHRSLNDRNLYNPAVGLMNGKKSDGSWAPLGGKSDSESNRQQAGWTEGDAWVYTWSPLHDQAGIIDLMGGAQAYDAKLDAHFAGGHNYHANEPSHHYGYLYDFGGEPWKTQAKVREIAAKEYGYDQGGLDGDDDCGQMSSWLLFTALGFYPVNPASGDYMIGSPMYAAMSLRLASGKTFRVEAENNSATNPYIQSATLNGKPLTIPVLTWEQIQAGGTLHFVMGPQPSQWGSGWRPAPVE